MFKLRFLPHPRTHPGSWKLVVSVLGLTVMLGTLGLLQASSLGASVVELDPPGAGNVPEPVIARAGPEEQTSADPSAPSRLPSSRAALPGPQAADMFGESVEGGADRLPDAVGAIAQLPEIQFSMILDGSDSISSGDWAVMLEGLAAAVENRACVPQDGTLELSVIQFSADASVEISPTVITAGNVAAVADEIRSINQMTSTTCIACGIGLAADTVAASPHFSPTIRQAFNLVTDGVPNRCYNLDHGDYKGNDCPDCGSTGCEAANESAVAARDYLTDTLEMTEDDDGLDAEGVGITDANRDWLRNNIVWPPPGALWTPPDPAPEVGWVRVVDSFQEFADTVCEKFQVELDSGVINVVKETLPADNGPAFDFTGVLNTSLAGGETASLAVATGTYTVTEVEESGWNLTAIACDDDDSSGDVGSRTATFMVDAGEFVTCTFTNTMRSELALVKQLISQDTGAYESPDLTFTIVVANAGPHAIDVLPLEDVYDSFYLSFVTATPTPEEDADDGRLTWYDLTEPPPHGFGIDLAPGEAFTVTAVFTVAHDITTTVNSAIVSQAIDVFGSSVPDVRDDETVTDVPTAIELLDFRIDRVSGREVTVAWATAVELNAMGFNLYRGPERDRSRADWVAFVPSGGHGIGRPYSYVDTVPADGVWWYWLGITDSQGTETVSGPVSGVVGAPTYPERCYLPLVLTR